MFFDMKETPKIELLCDGFNKRCAFADVKELYRLMCVLSLMWVSSVMLGYVTAFTLVILSLVSVLVLINLKVYFKYMSIPYNPKYQDDRKEKYLTKYYGYYEATASMIEWSVVVYTVYTVFNIIYLMYVFGFTVSVFLECITCMFYVVMLILVYMTHAIYIDGYSLTYVKMMKELINEYYDTNQFEDAKSQKQVINKRTRINKYIKSIKRRRSNLDYALQIRRNKL